MDISIDELIDVYHRVGRNAKAAADEIGMVHSTVYRRLKKAGVITPRDQESSDRAPEGKKRRREEMWGLGGPALLEPSTTKADEVVVGLFDLHHPRHEQGLLEKTLDLLAELQPDRIVFGGDVRDDSILSRWEQERRMKIPMGKLFNIIKSDLHRTKHEIFLPVKDACPQADLQFVEGNHDERLRLWLTDDLEESVGMVREWMELDELGIEWHPRCGFLLRPEFLIRHGHYVGLHTAKQEYEKTRCSGWSGHVHKKRTWSDELRETGRRYEWLCAPTMSRVDYDYGPGQSGLAPWSQGFVVGTFSTSDQYDYQTELAEFVNGRLRFRGEVR